LPPDDFFFLIYIGVTDNETSLRLCSYWEKSMYAMAKEDACAVERVQANKTPHPFLGAMHLYKKHPSGG
jgi:hypothetical protein